MWRARADSNPNTPYSPGLAFHHPVWTNVGMRKTRLSEGDNTLSVHDIKGASLPTLYRWFEALLGRPPPPKASPAVLRGNLAWALQARQQGKNPNSLRMMLKRAAQSPTSGGVSLKPGTRLVRSWRNQTHEVTVLEKGFGYQGQHFESLSEIARTITGTRWSGPRFFGLSQKDAK